MINWPDYYNRRKTRDDVPLTKKEAAEELLARRAARSSFIDFAQYVDDLYMPDPFHEALGEAFDKVVSGKINRLIINAPPQHGKSSAASEKFPAYWLGQRPNDPVIIASYGAELAEEKSRKVRDIVEGEAYTNIFGAHATRGDSPIEINSVSRAVYKWHLAPPYRGGVRAAGVIGPITGFPAKLGIIDDPVKDMKEAQSPTIREAVWTWYRSTFRTRINEGGAIILIMTRWHPEDLVGKILDQASKDQWTILRFPALAETQEDRDRNNLFLGLPVGLPDPLGREPGEPLAPRRFSKDELHKIRTDVGPMIWGAEYDNVPRLREGNMFKRDWFKPMRPDMAVPRQAKRVRYWDKAATEGGNGAASCGVLIAKAEGKFYIEHVVRGRYSAAGREDIILQTAQSDASKYGRHMVATWTEQEPGSGGKESADATIRNLSKHGFSIKADRPTGNKDLRLEPLAAQAEAGNVFILPGPWNEEYVDEMCAIPYAAVRDQGDASSGAFNILTAGSSAAAVSKVSGLPGRAPVQRKGPRS